MTGGYPSRPGDFGGEERKSRRLHDKSMTQARLGKKDRNDGVRGRKEGKRGEHRGNP